MSDFINTIDVLGDEAVTDGIINRSIQEFKDNTMTSIGMNAFRACTALEVVDLPNVTTCGSSVFYGCTQLKSANFPKLTTIISYMFEGCALTDVCFPEATTMEAYAFGTNKNLGKADFPKLTAIKGTNNFGYWAGKDCLTALILRSETMCTLENTGALGEFGATSPKTAIAGGTGYIYVPRALVDSYKAATNWSTYATQFRALEDYTVDGTTTGELDETKI